MPRSKIPVFLLIFTLAIFGCEKPKKAFEKMRLKTASTKTANSKQQEIHEEESLLNELKNLNPFFPEHSIGAAQSGQGSGLKGIVWDKSRPFAIIGYKIVVEGDEIDGKKVIKINKGSVELDDNGKKEIIKLE